MRGGDDTTSVRIPAARVELAGDLGIPEGVSGATHLFPEPGALEVVADLTADWFGRHLSA